MAHYHVLGLMSGTSLDGLDIAYCKFSYQNKKWNYEILKAKTILYPTEWKRILTELPVKTALEFAKTHVDYGHLLGIEVKKFIDQNKINVDFIGSHGHTIFHQPQNGFTTQIGDGASIAAETGIPVVCDFRSLDVALKGQGAPLVPIGDRLLFATSTFRLNIGGFANISYEKNGQTLAFDIAPANIAFNFFANQLGLEYDKNGELAEKGNFIPELFDALNQLDYYQIQGAKSLGREWFEKEFLPIIDRQFATEDILHTLVHHLVRQIRWVIERAAIPKKNKKLLISGGGVFNQFFMRILESEIPVEIENSSNLLIEYKEAMIFAFLAVLRIKKKTNTLASVSGAKQNSIGGAVYFIQ
jgi:anhydro-N-acetylmuramic acid kinase